MNWICISFPLLHFSPRRRGKSVNIPNFNGNKEGSLLSSTSLPWDWDWDTTTQQPPLRNEIDS